MGIGFIKWFCFLLLPGGERRRFPYLSNRRMITMEESRESRSERGVIPVWEKYTLSTEEASEYFHIGINKSHPGTVLG